MKNKLRLPGVFKNPLFVIAIAVLILSIAAMIYGSVYYDRNNDVTGVTKSLGSFVTWLQKGASGISQAITKAVRGPYWNADTYAEYKALKEEAAVLRRENDKMSEIEKENARLTALLELEDQYSEYSPIAARVTDREWDPYSDILVIDKGTSDGVDIDMAVVADGGLVGRVAAAGANWARVICVIDPNSAVPAFISATRDPGVVKGNSGEADPDRLLVMQYLSKDAEIMPGDRVITSGMGGVFDKGLVIGVVSLVDKSGSMYTSVVVEPSVDPVHLEEVLVIDCGGARTEGADDAE